MLLRIPLEKGSVPTEGRRASIVSVLEKLSLYVSLVEKMIRKQKEEFYLVRITWVRSNVK